jgi:hypothetical protein
MRLSEFILSNKVSTKYKLSPSIARCVHRSYGSGLPARPSLMRPLFINYPGSMKELIKPLVNRLLALCRKLRRREILPSPF